MLGTLDALIGILLIALALGALYSQTLYGSLTLFFAFGLIMTLAWARLGVPGLAMSEAVIGAGLSGALLYNALNKSPPEVVGREKPHHRLSAALIGMMVLFLLLRSFWPGLEERSVLPSMVAERLAESGAEHPVTAVLTSFRAWDTILEISVLLVALLGVKLLRPTHTPTPEPWPVLLGWGKVLASVAVLIGGYLLWRGEHGAGGAFQAGAVLAAGAVMLRLIHRLPPQRWSHNSVRLAILAGALFYIGLSIATAWLGAGWLRYPEDYAHALVTTMEITVTLSIAAALTLLAVGEGEELQS